jgi:hypothetical protein
VGHHSRLTKPWGHPDVTLEGSHPVAFVAAGSHATYPECKEYDLIRIYGLWTYATGDGLTIGPGDWQRRHRPGRPALGLGLSGRLGHPLLAAALLGQKDWGRSRRGPRSIGLPGVSGPRGPRYADDGSVRPNWLSAAAWAGIQELEKLAAGAGTCKCAGPVER